MGGVKQGCAPASDQTSAVSAAIDYFATRRAIETSLAAYTDADEHRRLGNTRAEPALCLMPLAESTLPPAEGRSDGPHAAFRPPFPSAAACGPFLAQISVQILARNPEPRRAI